MRNRLLQAVGLILPVGRFVGRDKAHDVAFTYRMGTGSAGEVNRTHPASIEPGMINVATPPLGYGLGVIVDTVTNSWRQLAAGDSGITLLQGVTVRPFPLQASSGTNYGAVGLGAATPPATGVMDILRKGYILVPVYGVVTKQGAVYVRVQNAAAGQPIGGFESADDGANTAGPITNCYFNGPAGSDGIGELVIDG